LVNPPFEKHGTHVYRENRSLEDNDLTALPADIFSAFASTLTVL